MDSSTGGAAFLHLMVGSASELTGDIKIGVLGCSDRALMESAVLRGVGQARSLGPEP